MNGVTILENGISLICELDESEPYITILANDPSYNSKCYQYVS
ncbi:hypothetical protein NMY3_00576 [Candidatus Nitrosocosmicus oleophilus]|uniref:Uncharacterized protein n=1 Tax=Candidatus Nitrosocosmicus oleophilus TaxID=1353260 RepID=A0A654LWI2_9ARCH|nr:hypothetical protein NMY3_00576 [Candidatus Nitrosocosmicus oleophilus]